MFDLEKLKEICFADIDYFHQFGEAIETPDGVYIYKDNGAKILAVAHLDSVQPVQYFAPINNNIVYAPQLDDRLGAYLILDLLPKLGMEFDILLTEGEESGRSTAQYFTTEKQYNWMFSFDREGDDTVLYQYATEKLEEILLRLGFEIGVGLFSDISYMGEVGCAGINFGCGYHNNHSIYAYLKLNELEGQLEKFVDFYCDYSNVLFEHENDALYYAGYLYGYESKRTYGYNTEAYDEPDKENSNYWERCEYCGGWCYVDDDWYTYGACEKCVDRFNDESYLKHESKYPYEKGPTPF